MRSTTSLTETFQILRGEWAIPPSHKELVGLAPRITTHRATTGFDDSPSTWLIEFLWGGGHIIVATVRLILDKHARVLVSIKLGTQPI